jgi:hypothetical protein
MKRITLVIAAALVAACATQWTLTALPETAHSTQTRTGEPATEMLWNKTSGNGNIERVRITVTGCGVGYGSVVYSTDPYKKLDWARQGGTDTDKVAVATCRYASVK